MNRGQFLRSLFVLAASPKVLAEIKHKTKVASSLFKDLQLVTPNYYKHYVEKYGSEDFTWWLNELTKNPANSRKFHFYEKGKVVESTEPGEPVTITITKDNFI